jgi:hypothetical protein
LEQTADDLTPEKTAPTKAAPKKKALILLKHLKPIPAGPPPVPPDAKAPNLDEPLPSHLPRKLFSHHPLPLSRAY